MKTQKFLILLIVATIMILQTYAISHQNDQTLIQTTCKNTPNYQLCVTTLRSNPGSSTADVEGLGLIMVEAVKAKTNEALSAIRQLKRSRQPKLTEALNQCAEVYNAVVEGDVAVAEQTVRGNPKFAENGMADAVIEANTCESAFRKEGVKSPLSGVNKAVRDLAEVARAVIRNLL